MDESGINKSWYEWCFFVFSCCLLGWLLEYFDIEELCEATADCEDRLSKELVNLFLGNVRNSWTKYPTHVAGLFFHIYRLYKPDKGTLLGWTPNLAIWQVQSMFCLPLFCRLCQLYQDTVGMAGRESESHWNQAPCFIDPPKKGQDHLLHITVLPRRVQKKSPAPSFEYSDDGGERISMFRSTCKNTCAETSHVKLEVILCILATKNRRTCWIKLNQFDLAILRSILRLKRVHTDISSRLFLGFQIEAFRVPVVP